MKYTIFFGIYLCMQMSYAQHFSAFSSHYVHPYSINPAAINLNAHTTAAVIYRHQWFAQDGTEPRLYWFSAATRQQTNIMGGAIFFDRWGTISIFSTHLTYAKDFRIIDEPAHNLTLALSIAARQFSINQQDYVYFDNDDPLITHFREHAFVYDTDFGALWHNERLQVGLALMNLLSPKIPLNISSESRLNRTATLFTAYTFNLSPSLQWKPAATIWLDYLHPNIIELSQLFSYQPFTAGISIGIPQFLKTLISFSHQNFTFCYGYQFYISSTSYPGKSAHEILLLYRLKHSSENMF